VCVPLDSTPEDVSQPDQVETGVSDEVHLVDEMTARDDDTAISKGSEVANIHAPPADLLNIIWQSLQKEREERKAERKQDKEIRRRDEEARLAAEKRNEERLAKLREDIINSAEIVSRQFRGELDKQVNIIDRMMGTLNESTVLWIAYHLHMFTILHIICSYNLIGTIINKFKNINQRRQY
jgi:hypothetical protein